MLLSCIFLMVDSGGDRAVFQKIYLTNSNPTVMSNVPTNDCFVVMDITDSILKDLDY